MSNETQTPLSASIVPMSSTGLDAAKQALIEFKTKIKLFYATDFTDEQENLIIAERTVLSKNVAIEIQNCKNAEMEIVKAERRSKAVLLLDEKLAALNFDKKGKTVDEINEAMAAATDARNWLINLVLGNTPRVANAISDGGAKPSGGGAKGAEAVEVYKSFRASGNDHTTATKMTAEKLNKTPNSFWAAVKAYRSTIGE